MRPFGPTSSLAPSEPPVRWHGDHRLTAARDEPFSHLSSTSTPIASASRYLAPVPDRGPHSLSPALPAGRVRRRNPPMNAPSAQGTPLPERAFHPDLDRPSFEALAQPSDFTFWCTAGCGGLSRRPAANNPRNCRPRRTFGPHARSSSPRNGNSGSWTWRPNHTTFAPPPPATCSQHLPPHE